MYLTACDLGFDKKIDIYSGELYRKVVESNTETKNPIQPIQLIHSIGDNKPIQVSEPLFQEKETENKKPSNNPSVWGPPFWFTLHVSSLYYPQNPSQIVSESMFNRILAIPYELPCDTCRYHATEFIQSKKGCLKEVVSSGEKLFNFYVDFHNAVNTRYGKPTWTYEKAREFYK